MATANISVSVDGAIGKMNALSRQVPFAMSVALNRTYDEAQFNIRRHIERVFVLRTPNSKRYILRTIRREKRDMATKKRLYADVRLQSPSRRHPNARILGEFVTGEPKVSYDPRMPVAIPTRTLRPAFEDVVPRNQYPQNLGFSPKKDPTGVSYYALGKGSKKKKLTPFKGKAIQGQRGTFVLDPRQMPGLSPKAWGVYRRIGPKTGEGRGQSGVVMLWSYHHRTTRPRILPMPAIVKQTVDRRWQINMQGAFQVALRSAYTAQELAMVRSFMGR